MDKRVVKNYIFNLVYQVLTLFLPLVTTPYISRCIGVENVGIYSFTSSVVSYFVLFVTFSFTTYGQKQVAYYHDDEQKRSQIFFEVQIKKLILLGLSIVAYIVLMFTTDKYQICYLIQIISLISVFWDISFFFQGMEHYKITVIRNLVIKILGVTLIFICVKDSSDLNLYIFIGCASILIGNMSLWPYLKKYVKLRYIKEVSLTRDNRLLLELFIPVLSVQLYFSIDKTMLGIFCDTTVENGYYEQALKIVRICQKVITSLGAVLISSISRMISEKDYDNIKSTVFSVIKLGTLLGCAMTFGVIAVSERLVPWFFGDGYDKVAIIMSLLSPIVTLSALSNVAGNGILIPTGRHNYLTLATAVTAGVNIVLNAILIPKYYACGAAVATVCSEVVVLVLQYYFARDYLYFKGIIVALIKYLIAGAIMFTGLFFVNRWIGVAVSDFVMTLIMMVVGGIIYVAILLIEKDEFVLKILGKIKGIVGK